MSSLPRTGALIGLAMGALAFLGLAFWRSAAVPPLWLLDGNTMGTTWSLQYWSGQVAPGAIEPRLSALLLELDKSIFSTYVPTSELSRLNRHDSDSPIAVSPHMHAVLTLAAQVHSTSNGAFDPTVGPLVNLWGFGPQPTDVIPSDHAIDAAMKSLGAAQVHLADDGTVRFDKQVELDLSGIAKGYAVDTLAALLEASGIDNYLMEIGGEIRVSGTRPDHAPWRIALEKPADGNPAAFAVLHTNGASLAVAGSGDYRNYRVVDGRRYSHEIDPRTGRPVHHSLASVTVVADTAALADAWATALMVLGPEEGLAIADGMGMAAYFIIHTDQGFAAQSSQRFQERFPDTVPL